MKATGIVRRIDDLGRVVIPKEIRRTMRIREGDPLEIFTSNDGEVIFKKYSPIGDLSKFADQYAEVLYKTSGYPAVVCDRDHIIAVAGVGKKEILNRRISGQLEDIMESRKLYSANNSVQLLPVEGLDYQGLVALVIVGAGDICGCVLLLKQQGNDTATSVEEKLIFASANFLGKQMEE